MSRWFNIGGPCNPVLHDVLPAVERLPEVVSLIRTQQFFVVHAPRQCGKTTAFQALADEINAKGDRVAFYCSAENAQGLDGPARRLPSVVGQVTRGFEVGDCSCWSGESRSLLETSVRRKVVIDIVSRRMPC